MRVLFFDAKAYDKENFDVHKGKYGVDIKYLKVKLNEETVDFVKGYEIISIFVNDTVNPPVIDKLLEHGVKLIVLRCAGYNNVDVNYINGRIKLVRVPAYSPYSVAEYTASLIMTLNRKIHKAYLRTREGNFSINGLMGFDLHKKTVGVIGAGRIARIFIKIMRGFDAKVIAYDPYPNESFAKDLGYEYVDLDTLYRESDIISLHCPLTKENTYLINRDSMKKMKDGVMLVNTGRGRLIDTIDLIEALKEKKVGAAALDVYEEEAGYFFEDMSSSIIEDDILGRLLSFNNVLLTSHQAYFTKEAFQDITITTLENIQSFLKGNELENEIK
ncbi:2-hydroxyacid dehydrogenase [Fusobacterium necrophorum]|uniref:2-hydroxyacid dehydrogenase n=1 Tax=Fusobacterium necrophorum TaxID=859 RepID=A0A4Q2KYX6_9FUSO|nr:2-hydroxyacid dehydrogenase [Fusobacterium necrophorum]RXZ70229.1 2-hydroxyacid dehydrogenase [Fusobacterium necrophorum]